MSDDRGIQFRDFQHYDKQKECRRHDTADELDQFGLRERLWVSSHGFQVVRFWLTGVKNLGGESVY
jgi:hypothetical protein